MKITLIPKDHIDDLWKRVSPMLQKAIDRNPGKYELIDIYSDCLTGVQALWVAFDEESLELHGCCTTRVLEYPMSRVLLLEWLAGSDVADWADDGFRVMTAYAKDYKCQSMECVGRRGWEPMLKKNGWEVKAYQYSKEVN